MLYARKNSRSSARRHPACSVYALRSQEFERSKMTRAAGPSGEWRTTHPISLLATG